MTALTEEHQVVTAILEELATFVEKTDHHVRHYDYDASNGHVYRFAVTSAHQMGAHKMAAFIAPLLKELSPAAAVLVGIAAAVNASVVEMGDVPVSSHVLSYDDIAVEHSAMTFRTEGYPVDPEMRRAASELRSSSRDYAAWSQACIKAIPAYINSINSLRRKSVTTPESVGTPHLVMEITAGGPFLLRDADFRDALRNPEDFTTEQNPKIRVAAPVHPKLVSAEMESHGFMNAAHERGVPAIVIKGISDVGDAEKQRIEQETGGFYRAFACANALMAVLHTMRQHPRKPLIPALREPKNNGMTTESGVSFPPGAQSPTRTLMDSDFLPRSGEETPIRQSVEFDGYIRHNGRAWLVLKASDGTPASGARLTCVQSIGNSTNYSTDIDLAMAVHNLGSIQAAAVLVEFEIVGARPGDLSVWHARTRHVLGLAPPQLFEESVGAYLARPTQNAHVQIGQRFGMIPPGSREQLINFSLSVQMKGPGMLSRTVRYRIHGADGPHTAGEFALQVTFAREGLRSSQWFPGRSWFRVQHPEREELRITRGQEMFVVPHDDVVELGASELDEPANQYFRRWRDQGWLKPAVTPPWAQPGPRAYVYRNHEVPRLFVARAGPRPRVLSWGVQVELSADDLMLKSNQRLRTYVLQNLVKPIENDIRQSNSMLSQTIAGGYVPPVHCDHRGRPISGDEVRRWAVLTGRRGEDLGSSVIAYARILWDRLEYFTDPNGICACTLEEAEGTLDYLLSPVEIRELVAQLVRQGAMIDLAAETEELIAVRRTETVPPNPGLPVGPGLPEPLGGLAKRVLSLGGTVLFHELDIDKRKLPERQRVLAREILEETAKRKGERVVMRDFDPLAQYGKDLAARHDALKSMLEQLLKLYWRMA
ncbi:hypothetical protein ACNOYE_29490 [Nannocystaceae bacterium ST9]